MAESNGMDDVFAKLNPIVEPDKCPRCGKSLIHWGNDLKCRDCGYLYYDEWLGIWRVKPYEEQS